MSNHFNEKLIRLDDTNQLIEFLRQPSIAIAEALTTVLSEPSNLRWATGRIVQASLQGNLYEQIGQELQNLREKGKIKEDYFATHNQKATLHELLKFIDESPPDAEVFNALKSIFFCAIGKDASDLDEKKAYQFLQICKQLTSGQILLLKACWQMYQTDPDQLKTFLTEQENRAGIPLRPQKWLQHMSSQMGLPAGLIEVHSVGLLELRLFQDSAGGDPNAISTINCRLSFFGIELCTYITRY